MAMSSGQKRPGGFLTPDPIPDVAYVRNQLAVLPEWKADVSHVQKFWIPKGMQVQRGTVGPQSSGGITYSGGAQQIEILNFHDRLKLIPVGSPIPIK